MAGDTLNEVGKYIKETRKDVDHALDRYQQRRARIERARDIFSSDLSFIMYFKTKTDENVLMDINFNKPPPGASFGTGTCEEFTIGTNNEILTTLDGFVSGSVSVFMNDIELATNLWHIYNAAAHQVYVNGGTFESNRVVICYERKQ